MASSVDERQAVGRSGSSYDLFGSTLTLRLTADDTEGAYALVEYDAPPGLPGSPTHRHEYTEEYIFVLEGKLNITLAGEVIVAGPGEGVLCPRGVEHAFANHSDDRTRFLTLLRPGGFEALLASVAARLANDGWEPTPEEFAEILAPFDIIVTEHAH